MISSFIFSLFLAASLAASTEQQPMCPLLECPDSCALGLGPDGCRTCGCLCAGKQCPEGTVCKEGLNGCENPPPGVACDPVLGYRCEPVCPDKPCGIRCQYGLVYSEGCQLCECLPNPCAATSCLVGSICEVQPNTLCEGIECPPFMGVCKAGCTNIACFAPCPYGYVKDENGCQIACDCLPDPCTKMECKPNYKCQAKQTTNCKKPPCPYIGVCVYDCPLMKCKECLGGNVIDANGCRTCQCLYPCEGGSCPIGKVCVVDETLVGKFRCVDGNNLCCPKPVAPANCKAAYKTCQNCQKDCSLMKCGGSTRCCPDWFGCHGCRNAVQCP